MKLFWFAFIEILLAVAILYFGSEYLSGTMSCYCSFDRNSYSLPLNNFSAVMFLVGVLSSFVLIALFNDREKKRLAAYEKEREKNTVSSSEKDDKIAALENKIKTLETALENVLKDKE